MTHSHDSTPHHHHHHHAPTVDFDWAGMAEVLVGEAEAFQPVLDGAFADLAELKPERVLDIGSGPGVAACLLAQRFPQAEVVAVDGTAELLEHAARRADRLGVRLTTVHAQFPDDLAALPEADLIWTSHVMHHVGDQVGALTALAGRLRPGGVLAVAEGGLPRRMLPRDIGFGRPGLQVRLDALVSARFDVMREELPGSVAVVEDWPEMLRAAGLIDARSRSYLVDRPAPLTGGPRHWVRQDLQRSRDSLADLLDADDLATLDRLLDPADPAGIDRRPDVFLLTAKTVHVARRPEH
ncbi:class I SAM-dependent methyltransferase [Nocardia sp. alder85J]|uniref:class I SAM-dependent methyltransferase n=1 Tax=Nocardia sp. alder85J TaxID=2862949 RepID=UPI001CD341BF|nr:class I SAM-dependent methyltransferase [Nocardia sp. alder85J]MCX4097968.1 class I SAM-dependent methyltransferase [Nocardia sp. alder85J]